jgi:hypothetical protein
MAVDFSKMQKGAEAIKAAAESKGGGGNSFRPFTPEVKWKNGDEKFIIFLNKLEDIPLLSIHEWIKVGTRKFGDKEFDDFYFGIARTDPVIGEDVDPLAQKGSVPTKRNLAVAVELEPIMKKNAAGRERPAGFRVATSSYTRKTDDGTEEVTVPVVGIVTQSAGNFFNLLREYDEGVDPIENLPFQIKRSGGDKDTKYIFTPYADQPVDFGPLVENIEGLSYLTHDEERWNELQEFLSEADEREAALAIGTALLERRINELADDELFAQTEHLTEIKPKYGNNDNGKKPDRPARQSQRPAASENTDSTSAPARVTKFSELKEKAAAAAK